MTFVKPTCLGQGNRALWQLDWEAHSDIIHWLPRWRNRQRPELTNRSQPLTQTARQALKTYYRNNGDRMAYDQYGRVA